MQFASEQNIPLLPYENQRGIAAILEAVDDKTELNSKMAAALEAMARAHFRNWFVDFVLSTPGPKAAPAAHIDPTSTALFPHSFGEDGVPVGWKSHDHRLRCGYPAVMIAEKRRFRQHSHAFYKEG